MRSRASRALVATAAIVAAVIAAVGAFAGPALAEHGGAHGINTGEGDDGNGDGGGGGEVEVTFPTGTVEVSAGYRSELGVVSEPDRSVEAGPRIGCYYFIVVDVPPYIATFGYAEALALYEAQGDAPLAPVGIFCFFIESQAAVGGYPRIWTPNPPPGGEPPLIDLIELETFTRDQIVFDAPAPELSPVGDQVVGVASWLAVTSQLDYDSVSAQAGPIWVTATPVFEHIRWEMGNGDELLCIDDVDVVWNPALGEDDQTSDCTYVYESNGEGSLVATNVTATATWTVYVLTSDDVAANPAAVAQPRGTITQATTVVTNVRELQAVID